jgi:quercetin dioxygenase-like cupin family protein
MSGRTRQPAPRKLLLRRIANSLLSPAMNLFLIVVTLVALCSTLSAQAPGSAASAGDKLQSTIFNWEKLHPTPTPNGVRRAVFEAPTSTLERIHCHITTLDPGAHSGEPRRHLQEEVIIIKEGQVEATVDGRTEVAGPGSVIFFAANAVTRLRNVGDGPATYTVVYYFTPLTPKE